MGYHLGSRCFVRSWKKRKKLVQSFKKDPKRPLISLCQNARFLISCELFVVFEYVNLCVCFFWCFYQNWMPCWNPQDGL